MRHNKAVIILSGFNQRAVIAFCRFAKQKQVQFFVVAKSDSDGIFETDFKDNVIFTRKSNDLNIDIFKESIALVKKNTLVDQFLVLPSSEALNRYLLKNIVEFKELKIEIPLVNELLYSTISDKYQFGKLCKKNKLSIPIQLYEPDSNCFPFVAKPRYYASQTLRQLKPYLIFNETDLNNFRKNELSDDFYYQEFVHGKSFYLLYYFSKDGKCSTFSQENLLQQSNGGSIIAARYSDVFQKKICKQYIQLFDSIGFFGLVMVEIKFRNNEFIMIEANPRLWGPSQYFLDAGSDLFDCFLEDNGFEINKTDAHINTTCLYFWNGGIVLNEKLLTFHDYSPEKCLIDYPELIQNDIYLRKDTINLYLKEITKIEK